MKQVFSHPDVEQQQLYGRVISGLLDIYQPLLKLSLEDFSELVAQERVRRYPPPGCIRKRISSDGYRPIASRLAYVEAVNKLARTAPEFALMEYYYRCRLIQDYISGMTDLYAWDEYRRLMAVE